MNSAMRGVYSSKGKAKSVPHPGTAVLCETGELDPDDLQELSLWSVGTEES